MRTPKLFLQINPQTNGMPEVPAQFPGGVYAMYRFIRERQEYPLLAMEEGTEGVVMIGFTVSETGSIEAPEVLHPLDFDCDQEALRLIRAMPKWEPARNLGKIVPVQVQLPVHFQLTAIPSEYE
ncbi:MAG: energy transducer TonB [Saprospiraceae bacterium]